MTELADVYGLGPYAERLEGSNPPVRTILLRLKLCSFKLRRDRSYEALSSVQVDCEVDHLIIDFIIVFWYNHILFSLIL